MLFEIQSQALDQSFKNFTYDNVTNTLVSEDGHVYEYDTTQVIEPSEVSSKHKSSEIRILKIQLGLSCNFSCTYCSQAAIPHAKETSYKDINTFLASINDLDVTNLQKIEFWGGEPLVYLKTLKPLSIVLRHLFPNVKFLLITNGSLLTQEVCDWLYDTNFAVGISHDAMGQYVRGDDPLVEESTKDIILKFYRKMHREKRISFNAVLTNKSYSRKAIYEWFVKVTGDPSVSLGEGGFVDEYNPIDMTSSFLTDEQHYDFRRTAFNDIYSTNGRIGFDLPITQIDLFHNTLMSHEPMANVTQKCGMDLPTTIAVDLRGNVLTCQNVSAASTSMKGISHKCGHIADISKVAIYPATFWKNRPNCASCPVLSICRGSCMILQDKCWDVSCNNAYSDAIVIFSLTIERLTGYIPYKITGGTLPSNRQDIWGTLGMS